jgi:hypothetical protein
MYPAHKKHAVSAAEDMSFGDWDAEGWDAGAG